MSLVSRVPGGENALHARDQFEFGTSAAIPCCGRLEGGHLALEIELSPKWELLHQPEDGSGPVHGYVALVEIVGIDAKSGVGQRAG